MSLVFTLTLMAFIWTDFGDDPLIEKVSNKAIMQPTHHALRQT